MSSKFILCPLCGSSNWSIISNKEKTVSSAKCGDCKKFTHSTCTETRMSPMGLKYFEKVDTCIEAEVNPFHIQVQFGKNPITLIRKSSDYTVIITLQKAIQFNWQKQSEVIEQVQKYIVFS